MRDLSWSWLFTPATICLFYTLLCFLRNGSSTYLTLFREAIIHTKDSLIFRADDPAAMSTYKIVLGDYHLDQTSNHETRYNAKKFYISPDHEFEANDCADLGIIELEVELFW